MKRRLTLSLDEEVIARANVLAEQRGKSMNALIATEITRLLERYERTRDAAPAPMDVVDDQAGS